MNICLINTYTGGGAGIACRRLQVALQESGHTVNLLTAADAGFRWPFYAERLSFVPYEHDKSVRFSFSLANFGTNISRHPFIQQADVLHLHWINQGLLSLEGIQQLATLGKPIVWTLHDMWAFTGGCHYSRGCDHFKQQCGHCPFLKKPGTHDLSNRIWVRKQRLFPPNIHFVTCSKWLGTVAQSSSLLNSYPITAIPNPIDTNVFKPCSMEARAHFRAKNGIAPSSFVLLFVAMKISEERKGFRFLQEALHILKVKYPHVPIEILVLGKSDPEILTTLPYPVHALGLVTSAAALASAYGAADAFVIPSLEDNLPNTVMEALSCGTPVVGFATGGIPEMIGAGGSYAAHFGPQHQGYLAPQGDSSALAAGILWISTQPDMLRLRKAARQKVEDYYANTVVASQYLAIYREMLAHVM